MIQEVIQRVARHFKMPVEDLTGRSRPDALVVPRQMCYLFCRSLGWSTLDVGKAFGRCHTTIVKGCQEMEGRMGVDARLQRKYRSLCKKNQWKKFVKRCLTNEIT